MLDYKAYVFYTFLIRYWIWFIQQYAIDYMFKFILTSGTRDDKIFPLLRSVRSVRYSTAGVKTVHAVDLNERVIDRSMAAVAQPLWVSWVSGHPQKFKFRVTDTPKS